MKSILEKSLILTFFLTYFQNLEASFSKPLIDTTDQEYQSYLKSCPDNQEESVLENQIEDLRLFCIRYELYCHQDYLFIKNLQKIKERDPKNLKKKNISLIENEILKLCGSEDLDRTINSIIISKNSIAGITQNFEDEEEKDPDFLAKILEALIEKRMGFLSHRSQLIVENSQRNNKDKINIVYTYTDEGLNAFDKTVYSRVTNQFSFINQLIKKIYRIVPKETRTDYTNKYLEKYNILNKFLESNSWYHCSPDNSFEDLVNHNKFFMVDVLEKETGRVEKISLKNYEQKLSKMYPEGAIFEDSRNMSRSKSKILKQKIRSSRNKSFNKQAKKNRNKILNAPSIVPAKRPQPKEKSIKDKASSPMILQEYQDGFINEYSLASKEPIITKEKIKTRGQANLDLQSLENPPLEKNLGDLKNTQQPAFKYIKKKKYIVFEDFWKTNSGFTYNEFKKMFEKLGGIVDEHTGSSHMRLIYKDHKGIKHKDGIWKMHGGITQFDSGSTSFLKRYLRKCGLTLDTVYPLQMYDSFPS